MNQTSQIEQYIDIIIEARQVANSDKDQFELRAWSGQSIKQAAADKASEYGCRVTAIKNPNGSPYTGPDIVP